MQNTRNHNFIRKIIPPYAGFPLLLMLTVNIATYYGTKLLAMNLPHHSVSTTLDEKIPFLSIFIIPYMVAYLQWLVGYVIICRESKHLCYTVCYGEVISKVLTFITFVVYPTIMIRPDVNGTGFFNWLIRLIYKADSPVNLFPSIHCLESFYVFFGCLSMKTVKPWYKWTMGFISLLVCLSTVFIKQHVVLDIAGGLLYCGVGLFISALIFRNKQ